MQAGSLRVLCGYSYFGYTTKVGMSTKLSVALINDLAALIEKGSSMSDAALINGLWPGTVERWMSGDAITEFARTLPDDLPSLRNSLEFQEVTVNKQHSRGKEGKGKKEEGVETLSGLNILQKKKCVKDWLNIVIRRAEAKCKAYHLALLTTAGQKSWQASAWILERSYPERYALRTSSNISSNVRVQVVTSTPRPNRGKARKQTSEDTQ